MNGNAAAMLGLRDQIYRNVGCRRDPANACADLCAFIQMQPGPDRICMKAHKSAVNLFLIEKGTDVPFCRAHIRINMSHNLRPQGTCDWSMILAVACRHRKRVRAARLRTRFL